MSVQQYFPIVWLTMSYIVWYVNMSKCFEWLCRELLTLRSCVASSVRWMGPRTCLMCLRPESCLVHHLCSIQEMCFLIQRDIEKVIQYSRVVHVQHFYIVLDGMKNLLFKPGCLSLFAPVTRIRWLMLRAVILEGLCQNKLITLQPAHHAEVKGQSHITRWAFSADA